MTSCVEHSDQLICTEHLSCYVSDHGSCNGICGLMQAFNAVMPHGQEHDGMDTHCFCSEILTVVDTRNSLVPYDTMYICSSLCLNKQWNLLN